MNQPLTPTDAPAGAAQQADLWKPVLLRAVAALLFGAATIFWAGPSVQVMGWAGGLYLLATGLLVLWAIPKTGYARDGMPGKILSAAGATLAGAGVALALLHGDRVFGVVAAVGLGLAGAVELYCGLKYRRRHVLARDWLASGIIGLGTAAILPFFISLGAHALLGVAGGGAIISGVLWVLSGLTLRHDSRPASTKP
ncbi:MULTISPECIES: hypothetical protein [unclassified Pseudarthrobacter]|uniref:hypothetical protein n=1 Tax=unclassified Pseudarthrobacter TaxID=2647000 RepID=UPI001130D844|nr:hypothetical protein [Pseudarthrobacter sp. NIBRBAC000502772]QDG65115.1 hypothetical protein NIBR502772_01875 [Pseudarthrobacter sp. NIBRBAC000502772]